MNVLENIITREEIFEEYPYFTAENKYLVIGNDLDSLISAAFWCNFIAKDTEIVAIYSNFDSIFVSDKSNVESLKSAIWLDLDIAKNGVKSIGHHIISLDNNTIATNQKAINLNNLHNISLQNFTNKYPFATLHFLIWLFNIDISNDKYLPWLVFLADSSYINCQKYYKNAHNWIHKFINQESLIKYFYLSNSADFNDKMKHFVQLLEKRGISKQWVFAPNNSADITMKLEVIAKITNWEIPKFSKFELYKKGIRKTNKIQDILSYYGHFDNFIKEKNVFSFAFPFIKDINWTQF